MSRRPGEATQWSLYYEAVQTSPPHRTLLETLDRFDAEPKPARGRQAVDLGCGTGRDALEMLRRGWRVYAVDQEDEALRELTEKCPEAARGRLETWRGSFTEARLPRAHLINASFSLPFAEPDAFQATWKSIRAALEPGGRFAGHFLGDRDQWARGRKPGTYLTRDQVQALMKGLTLESFTEKEEDGQTAEGHPHLWHVFSVVARRPAGGKGA